MKRSIVFGLTISLTLLLVVVLLVSGCTTPATTVPGTTPATTTPATTTPPVTNTEPIKIGVAVPFSGYLVGDGLNAYQGVSKAVDEINSKGGLLGRPIQIIKYDNQDLSPERVTQGADYLVGQEKVDMVSAGWSGSGGDVAAYGKYPVPFFHCDGSQQAVDIMKQGGFTNIWMLNDVEANHGKEMWKFATSIPYSYPNKKLALVVADDNFTLQVVNAIQDLAVKDGWEVVIRELVPYGTTEWSPILTKVRSQQPSLLYFEMPSAPDQITFMQGFLENPSQSIVDYGYGTTYREFVDALGSKADGLIGVSQLQQDIPYPPPSQAAYDWYQSWLEKYGTRPAGTAPAVYQGVIAWAQAVVAVGDPSNYAAINEYLGTHPFTIWEGADPIIFSADHSLAIADNPYPLGQIQNGVTVTTSYKGQPYTDWEGKTYNFIVPPWIQ